MKADTLALILTSVSLSAMAQLFLKAGMSSPSATQALLRGQIAPVIVEISTNIWLLTGLVIYFVGALIWLLVLARVEVSQAYPFVGIGFILTMVFGRILMGDHVTAIRVIGTLMVAGGVALIARS